MRNDRATFRQAAGPWVPFAFCAFLCAMVLFIRTKIGLAEAGYPAFYSFLPMTFFFVAAQMVEMRREIKRLAERVEQLENEKGHERA